MKYFKKKEDLSIRLILALPIRSHRGGVNHYGLERPGVEPGCLLLSTFSDYMLSSFLI